MTDKTNTPAPAHEALLTDEDLDAIRVRMRNYVTCNIHEFIRIARRVETALLSKLRAPVVVERDRNATISEVVGLCNRIPGATTWNAAEFMYDEMHRRATLASAPVAGEAQWPFPTPGTLCKGSVALGSGCGICERCKEEKVRLWAADPKNAAPQASEEVRDADEVTPEMLRAAQMKSELGAIACADYSGGYDLITELYQVMCRAALSAQPGAQKGNG